MKRTLISLALNLGQISLCYAWLFDGQEWAGNLLKIMAGIVLLTSLTLIFGKDLRAKLKKAGPSIPRELAVGFDLAIVGMLGAQAHFWMAGIYLLSMAAESYAFSDED